MRSSVPPPPGPPGAYHGQKYLTIPPRTPSRPRRETSLSMSTALPSFSEAYVALSLDLSSYLALDPTRSAQRATVRTVSCRGPDDRYYRPQNTNIFNQSTALVFQLVTLLSPQRVPTTLPRSSTLRTSSSRLRL